jgi:N-methylhydantoinase A
LSNLQSVSVDVGGTFTDVLCVDATGKTGSYKLPSVAPDKLAALLEQSIGTSSARDELLYSTTVTLNGLLGGDLPPVGLIVTKGFREILETARLPPSAGNAPPSALPRRLVALEWVNEVNARLEANGTEREVVDREQVETLARDYLAAGISVVAVALLHSYLNPMHENAVATIFSEVAPTIEVVRSSVVLPESREYERTLATVLNACLIPVLQSHLEGLVKSPSAAPQIWLMQSNGGLASSTSLTQQPLSTALSGPGAAVVGMRWLGETSGYENLITLDVGGTSTDVAVIKDARYSLTTSGEVAGFPIKTPMLDVLSIGAGGGSIAREAADRRWHVGPESAGASPGPACYSTGGEAATLTDAQLVLGRIPDALLGGSVPLDRARALEVLTELGRKRGFDALRAARGILEIASHNMCGAIRRVSVLRGHDPSAYSLLAMGGAGPAHAAEVAELLGMKTVIVPPQPGLAAAWGLLVADITHDVIEAIGVIESALEMPAVARAFTKLRSRANAWADLQGVDNTSRDFVTKLDLRYAGMTHETTIECPNVGDLAETIAAGLECFHDYFADLTGRIWRDQEAVEIVNLRLSVTVRRVKPELLAQVSQAVPCLSGEKTRNIGFLGHSELVVASIIDRATLTATTVLTGPAIIEQYESTTVVPPGWQARTDDLGNLILENSSLSTDSTNGLAT